MCDIEHLYSSGNIGTRIIRHIAIFILVSAALQNDTVSTYQQKCCISSSLVYWPPIYIVLLWPVMVWNRSRRLFKLDGIRVGIESTSNFSAGIGINLECWNSNLLIPALKDCSNPDSNGHSNPPQNIQMESRSRNRNWTHMESESMTLTYAGIGIGIEGAGIILWLVITCLDHWFF